MYKTDAMPLFVPKKFSLFNNICMGFASKSHLSVIGTFIYSEKDNAKTVYLIKKQILGKMELASFPTTI